ncbi:TPA: hypothetical protein ENS27_15460 [bacterium]|nr:hypothetical protein [bacterium]
MKILNLIIILIAIFLASCATKTDNSQLDSGFKNHALSSNGATISLVAHSGLSPNVQHPLETLINGNHSSDDWANGEGWECEYQSRQSIQSGQTRYGSESASLVDILIEFPQETLINRIVIYTIDNKEFPAINFGVSDLGVRYPVGLNAWAPVELIGLTTKYPARIQENKKGIINFRFKPIKTKSIKLFICDTNDSIDTMRDRYTRIKNGFIRLIEIEAYGTDRY